MKINTLMNKVFYNMNGSKRVKGFATIEKANWFCENVAKVFDEKAFVKVVIK